MKFRSTIFVLGLTSLLGLPINPIWIWPVGAEQQSVDQCTINMAEEAAIIRTTKGKAVRQGKRLVIKTRQGSLTFQDICNAEQLTNETTAYRLKAYYADVQYFLVHNTSIEYNEYILINAKTAAKTTLYGVPVFSPNRQRFTAMVTDELNGLTSIEIYRLTTKGLQREYQNTNVHGPKNPRWKNNSTIEFQRTLDLGTDFVSSVLRRQNGRWKLN